MSTLSTIKTGSMAVLLSIGMLSACSNFPFRPPQEKAAELPANKGLIVFEATEWDGAARRVQYSDSVQRVDFALFRGKDDAGAGSAAQAEFIYMERPLMAKVAFEFPFTIRDKVESWNFSKDQAVEWQKAKLVRTELGQFFYRPYRLTAKNRQCFGLSGEWDAAFDDPNLRDTRILFGYYCAPPGVLIGDEKLAALIAGIGLRSETQRSVVYAPFFHETMSYGKFYQDVDDLPAAAKILSGPCSWPKGKGPLHPLALPSSRSVMVKSTTCLRAKILIKGLASGWRSRFPVHRRARFGTGLLHRRAGRPVEWPWAGRYP